MTRTTRAPGGTKEGFFAQAVYDGACQVEDVVGRLLHPRQKLNSNFP